MKIGEAAAQSGVSAKMIRYYESIGLIGEALRLRSGYRTYSVADVHTLKFIRRCRELGFGMNEISELLNLWQDRGRRSRAVRKLASRHLEELETRIQGLKSVAETLSHLVHACHGDDRPDCPILEDLEAKKPREKEKSR
jgi:MerR family transcriptional regulator, copper efflux regulator